MSTRVGRRRAEAGDGAAATLQRAIRARRADGSAAAARRHRRAARPVGARQRATAVDRTCRRRRRPGRSASRYVVEPFAKRGELDQGILRFTWYSLVLVAKGYALALLIGTPLGFLLGLSKLFTQELRPDHPDPAPGVAAGLAAARPGAVPELEAGGAVHHRDLRDVADGAEHRARRALDPAGLPERRAGAAAVAGQDASSRSCCRPRCPTCSPASA